RRNACMSVSTTRSSKRMSRSPPPASTSSSAGIDSSSVDLPEPFSPTRNVTLASKRSSWKPRNAGSVQGKRSRSGSAQTKTRRTSGSGAIEEVLAHQREPFDVMHVVVELGDEGGRGAELAPQPLAVRGPAQRQRAQLVQRRPDAPAERRSQLLRHRAGRR